MTSRTAVFRETVCVNAIRRCSPSQRSQRGLTLIEQLVTLVIVSVGLLGIAALQVSGLRSSHEAGLRLRASMLATDIIERMRANTDSARNGAYDSDFNELGAGSDTAKLDLSQWQAEIDRQLPGGAEYAAGAIARMKGSNAIKVTVRWRGSSNAQTVIATTYAEF